MEERALSLVPQRAVLAAGVDLVDVNRVADLHAQWPERLVRRLCSPEEIAVLAELSEQWRPHALALAFGLKESTIKAAGGIPHGGRFTDTDGSDILRRSAHDSRLSGRVRVTGSTGAAIDGRTEGEDRRCEGGAVLLDAGTWLCWVMVEGAAA